jgi:NADH-quinone oxidoreductase subunit E
MPPEVRPEHADITDNMWTQIDAIITSNSGIPGAIIGVLRECQDIVGWLPIELIDYISDGLNLSRSEVFGIATFYALFFPDAERQTPDQSLHGHCLLCKRH